MDYCPEGNPQGKQFQQTICNLILNLNLRNGQCVFLGDESQDPFFPMHYVPEGDPQGKQFQQTICNLILNLNLSITAHGQCVIQFFRRQVAASFF